MKMNILDLFRRNKPKEERKYDSGMYAFIEDFDKLECVYPNRYIKLSDCPEVRMAIERIADLISIMTIYLMKNEDNGDVRVRNGLSRRVDVKPYKYMTRQQWVHWIVKEMLLYGNAIVVPEFDDDVSLKHMKPIPNSHYRFVETGDFDYKININESRDLNYDQILHFKINPMSNKPYRGESYRIVLKDVMENLKQSSDTVKEFMTNKMMPSLIVKVDALTDELASDEGREKIEEKFIRRSKTGMPWIVPSGLIDVQQVKPLTLNDIAIDRTIKLSKETVAGILGVPAFLLGIGDFNEKEYNNFVRTRILTIAKAIEQELTLKLLISPNHYFKFNANSLYAYSLEEISRVYSNLYIRGVVTGNEVRDKLGMSPNDNLDELTILENFIPLTEIGNQEKLGGDDNDEKTN